MYRVIVFPGLHLDDCAADIGEVVQCACHRAVDTGNTLLTSHAGIRSQLWPATSTATKGVHAAPSSRHTDGTSDIRTDADAASPSEQCSLSAS